jgi:hypothetical protein
MIVIILLIFSIICLVLYHKSSIENFFLSKELVNKYMIIKQKELESEYGNQAWEYCSDLMKLSLKWSPDEKEVSTIQDKEFPCGNTVSKCLKKVVNALKNGKKINKKINDKQLSDYLNDGFYA